MARFCGKCGAPLVGDTQFCEECGAPVPSEGPPPPPQPMTSAPAPVPGPATPPKKEPAPSKKSLPLPLIIGAGVVIVIIIAAIVIVPGLISPASVNGFLPGGTVPPTQTFSLEPGPVDTVPSGNTVAVQVSRDPYTGISTSLFAGGPGQKVVQAIEITVMRQDGTTLSGNIQPILLSEVQLQGTRRGVDRVIVRVTYESGETYKILDRQFSFND